MKRVLPTLFILLFFAFSGYPKKINLDSLIALIPSRSGTDKIDLLNEISWSARFVDPTMVRAYARQAIKLSAQYHYQKGFAYGYRNLAIHYYLKGKADSLVFFADQALVFANQLDDPFIMGKILNAKGMGLADMGKYAEAVDHYQRSLSIFRKLDNKEEISGMLNNLALIYVNLKDYEKALSRYYEVVDVEESIGNKTGLARTYNNLAGLYDEMGLPLKALELYHLSIRYADEMNTLRFKSAALHGIGSIYEDLDSLDKALVYYEQSVKINQEKGFKEFLANNYVNLSRLYSRKGQQQRSVELLQNASLIYSEIDNIPSYTQSLLAVTSRFLDLKQYPKARETLKLVKPFISRLGQKDFRSEYLFLEYELARETGNYRLAMELLEAHLDARDSAYQHAREDVLLEMDARFDLTRKEAENQKLKLQNELKGKTIFFQRTLIASILVLLVLAIFLALIIFRSRRKLDKANKLLESQNAEIQNQAANLAKLNATKDKLFSVISHDLRNPFHAIISLSEQLRECYGEMSDTEKMNVISSITVSGNMAYKLLENLLDWAKSQTGQLNVKPVPIDLHHLISVNLSLLSTMATNKGIQIKMEVPSNTIVQADHDMLDSVIRNLISNAIKFTKRAGWVMVTSHVTGDGHIQVTISDTGVGIDAENMKKLFTVGEKITINGTDGEPGTGLGLLLCSEFLRLNGSKLFVESQVGVGSRFYFSLPEK